MESETQILIIGGTGYLGKYIAEASVKAGHRTLVLIRESTLTSSSRAEIINSFRSLGVQFVMVSDHFSFDC